MSILSEQVKTIRDCVKKWQTFENVPSSEPFKLLLQAADTIEDLSAKLSAANMERSDRYYGGGWIACEDRLPNKDDTVLIDTGIGHFEIATYSGDGRTFYTEECGSSCPVAWQHLPEPYHP